MPSALLRERACMHKGGSAGASAGRMRWGCSLICGVAVYCGKIRSNEAWLDQTKKCAKAISFKQGLPEIIHGAHWVTDTERRRGKKQRGLQRHIQAPAAGQALGGGHEVDGRRGGRGQNGGWCGCAQWLRAK